MLTVLRRLFRRIDAVVHTNDLLYVMEFKYGKSAREALDQDDEKG